jgi:hypothetical protein
VAKTGPRGLEGGWRRPGFNGAAINRSPKSGHPSDPAGFDLASMGRRSTDRRNVPQGAPQSIDVVLQWGGDQPIAEMPL